MSSVPEVAAVVGEDDQHSYSVVSSSMSSSMNSTNAAENTRSMSSSTDITLSQRMASASVGSLITSLVVTPFDVVRIRMQQQEIMPSNCCAVEGDANGARRAPGTAPRLTASPLVGAMKQAPASFASTTPASPTSAAALSMESAPEIFWVSENYCKSAENCSKINSTFQGFNAIAKSEGLATLWRGLSLTLFIAIPTNVIYFAGYEYIRDNSPFVNHALNPLLCGCLARTISTTTTLPFELLKTRLQAIPVDEKGKNNKVLSHLVKDMVKLVKHRGVGSLFTGLQITLWRDVPFSGVYWSSYEVTKPIFSNLLKSYSTNQSEDLRVFTSAFISGSLSGTIAALCTNPFDVGKTRLQITSENSHSGVHKKQPSMFKFLANIYRKEGMGALYKGIYPRIMKVAPSCAIMISSYEIGKKFFQTENGLRHSS